MIPLLALLGIGAILLFTRKGSAAPLTSFAVDVVPGGASLTMAVGQKLRANFPAGSVVGSAYIQGGGAVGWADESSKVDFVAKGYGTSVITFEWTDGQGRPQSSLLTIKVAPSAKGALNAAIGDVWAPALDVGNPTATYAQGDKVFLYLVSSYTGEVRSVNGEVVGVTQNLPHYTVLVGTPTDGKASPAGFPVGSFVPVGAESLVKA